MRTQWTPAQDRYLVANQKQQDAELAMGLSAIGPERTLKAVESRRKALGLKRPPRPYVKPAGAPTREACRERETERRSGWPRMSGSPEARDKGFVEAVRRAKLEQVRG